MVVVGELGGAAGEADPQAGLVVKAPGEVGEAAVERFGAGVLKVVAGDEQDAGRLAAVVEVDRLGGARALRPRLAPSRAERTK